MGFFSRRGNIADKASKGDIPGTRNVLRDMDFFAFTGLGCSPAFCIDLRKWDGINQAYNECSTLATVINRNAMAMANGKWWAVDKEDNEKIDSYPQLSALFRRPNPIQTFTEFITQMDVYRQLYGEVFIYAVVPTGSSKTDASALWVINPRYISIEMTGRLYMQSDKKEIVSEYYLTAGGSKQKLDRDRILHIKDINQNLGLDQRNIRGKSRLLGLGNSIQNIIQAEEAIYALNRDRGAMGILSNDSEDKIGTLPITPLEKQEIHKQYNSNYGLQIDKAKVVITEAKLKWLPLTFNVKDLMLYEGIDKNIQLIASAFGYPYELLGVLPGSTFNSNSGKFNSESKRLLYQDTIIPISKIYAEYFTDFFGLENDEIIIDFDHVESLKIAESEAANTLYKKAHALHGLYVDGIITREEYRLSMGYDEDFYGETLYQQNDEQE